MSKSESNWKRRFLGDPPQVRLAKGALVTFGALALVASAVLIPGMVRDKSAEDAEVAEAVDRAALRVERLEGRLVRVQAARERAEAEGTTPEVSEAPAFVPYTVKPDYVNRREIAEALAREYPPLLRDAGIGGTVHVWFFIDENGQVQNHRLNTSSGHEALDEAALRVAPAFKFTPALNREEPVSVWISLPITFTIR